ncbi:MAG: hypothetical protein JST93_20820 [Acidobacteria bacterium]|nr:hypothetical protein [Acidobacteriota bacterium]
MWGWFQRRRNAVVALYFAWFIVPLALASMYRPFAFWDYFTSGDLFHYGRPIAWGTLVGNAAHQFLTGTFVVRPVTTFLYDLQVLVFGGEFWLWYAVKWAAFFAAVWVVTELLGKMGCGWEARAAVAALLLFHPARFTLMLHAPDGWLALGICGQLLFLWRYEFRASVMTWQAQLLWFGLALFTIGTKEAGYVFQGLLVVFVFARDVRGWVRLMPHVLMLMAWTWRLRAASGRAGGFVFGEWLWRLREQCGMMLPDSTLQVVEIVLLGLAGFSIVWGWRERRSVVGQVVLFCWVAAGAMLMFVTVPKVVALRYAIPSMYVAAIPVGVALQHLPRMYGRWLAAGLIAAYPLITAGHVYRQELAYRDLMYQSSELLRRLEMKGREGYLLAMSELPGDLEGEPRATVEYFFGDRGLQWYGPREKRGFHGVKQKGWPAGRFAMASYLPVEVVTKDTGLDIRRIDVVEVIYAGDHGPLGRLAAWYLWLDGAVRRGGGYAIDLGAPDLEEKPRFYLYTVGEVHEGGYRIEPVGAGRRPGAF